MNQMNSVFMPGLSARGPVYGADASFGALPTLSPMMKYGLMAGLAYLGYKKTIPMVAGIGLALALWKFLPDATTIPPVAGLTADQQAAVDAANSAASAIGTQF